MYAHLRIEAHLRRACVEQMSSSVHIAKTSCVPSAVLGFFLRAMFASFLRPIDAIAGGDVGPRGREAADWQIMPGADGCVVIVVG